MFRETIFPGESYLGMQRGRCNLSPLPDRFVTFGDVTFDADGNSFASSEENGDVSCFSRQLAFPPSNHAKCKGETAAVSKH